MQENLLEMDVNVVNHEIVEQKYCQVQDSKNLVTKEMQL